MQLRFLGGAGTASGSKILLEQAGRRLLVDCGLFQGLKQLRLRNWSCLPVPAGSLDAVLLTQAELNHSGFLPRLVELGFRGEVYATPATAELCERIWPEAGRLQEEEAGHANREGFSKHSPACALYTEAAGRHAAARFQVREIGEEFKPLAGVQACFHRAGHSLGAASLHLRCGARSVLFSGDLGRSHDALLMPPEPPEAADFVVVEATGGNRSHRPDDTLAALGQVISLAASRGGVVIVTSPSATATASLLHGIRQLKATRRIPDLPVHLDSPMSADFCEVLARHADELRLSADECLSLYDGIDIAGSEEQSRALGGLASPAIVVASTGMAGGGRLLHHLKAFAGDARHAFVLAGPQASGTRGAAMGAGAAQIKAHGEWIAVRAEVARLDGLSAGANRDSLLAWIGQLPRAPSHIYLTDAEPEAADALRQAIEERYRWPCSVAEFQEIANLDLFGAHERPQVPVRSEPRAAAALR